MSEPSTPKFPGTQSHPVAGFVDKNKAFISKFKSDNNVKTQSKLPSAIDVQNEMIVREGGTLWDATMWRKWCDKVKFGYNQYTEANLKFLNLCEHLECTPWALIKLGRELYAFRDWGTNEIQFLMDHLVVSDNEGSYEETDEPYNANPTSAEAYDIDDDAPSSGNGKRKRVVDPDEDE